ncbi:MAG TPA: hypothetical protein VGM07_00805 [Stellaceae bacterium]|jgi:hypothetical protein
MLRTIAVCSILLFAAAAPLRAQPAMAPAHSAAGARAHTVQPRSGVPSDLAADQFSSESAAKTHCPGDTVVWANLGGSKAYHLSGNKYYGKTKHGAFMCQKEADQAGYHAAGRRAATKSAHTKTSK